MSDLSSEVSRTAVIRAAWIAAGLLALLLHLPAGRLVLPAIGIPWAFVMFLLARQRTSAPLVRAWRDAIRHGTGVLGLIGLGLAVVAVAVIAAPAAGAALALWLAAGASLVGVMRGTAALRDQLVGWSLLAVATGCVLLLGEGVLRLDAVARRVGTQAEVDAWWRRYDDQLNLNVLGIRSPYEIVRRDPGVVRVVAIGDSFTWGDKIASSDSIWPAQLEGQLRGRTGHRVEVVNLGQKAFTATNNAEMLRRLGWQFDPDIVVVQFYLNDILPGASNFKRGYTGWLFPRAALIPERYRKGPIRRSALLDVTEGALTALRHGDRAVQAAKWTEVYLRQGREWVAVANALTEMGEAAAERGVPIVLMLFPDLIPGLTDEHEPPFAAIHEQVARAARAAGFSILDLTPFYVQAGGDMRRWWATRYDAHPNAAAAGLAARVLADHLIDSYALEPRDAPATATAAAAAAAAAAAGATVQDRAAVETRAAVEAREP